MILDSDGDPIAQQPLTDAQLLALVVDEITRITATRVPIILGPIAPAQGLELVGLLQLATRHPSLGPRARYLARHLIDELREYFADAPATLDLIRRGDDPAQDRPARDR